MKKVLIIIILAIIFFITGIKASLPLSGKYIIIDVGHGGIDVGTSYNNILEKDINLSISKILESVLIRNGASVRLTRDGDYDLASPNVKYRKKSDFDNRIRLINNSKCDMYLSIHTNYLSDSSYYGAQVFYYNNNKKLADSIQSRLNSISYPRNTKVMPNIYMYKNLNKKGVLIEVGFLSNSYERNMLLNKDYQYKLSKEIVNGLIDYYN